MLENIFSFDDVKKISIKDLPVLCQEIRDFLVPIVLENGGHLSSNLGVVELTVALAYVFDQNDKFVWDVGHQSYVYKILSGRREEFNTLRQKGGLSGFPDTAQSQFDTFNTGHASTSISVALGLATARDVNKLDYNVIAIIGDGALGGGMSFEALNNIALSKMLIIVNDNGLAINKVVGNTASGLANLRVGKYDKRKESFKKFILKIPLLGKLTYKICSFCKRVIKYGFIKNNLYFNSFDIKYIGSVDGHNVAKLISLLQKIKKNVEQPTILHIKTTKGKGYAPAELNPELFHGVSKQSNVTKISMSNVVGATLTKLAKEGSNIVAITAAMTSGTGLDAFASNYPDKFFDCGIAEQHAVTFASSLASCGVKPYFCVYSTFLQRGFDQIIHDTCLQNLPVVFCIDRAGFVGADGKTHQGLFDLSYLSLIPNLTILAPADETQLEDMLLWSANFNSPLAIRYSKDIDVSFDQHFDRLSWNRILNGESKVELLCVGNRMINLALQTAQELKKYAISINITNACVIKPLDNKFLSTLNNSLVITLEENVLQGGFGSAVTQFFATKNVSVVCLAQSDKFVEQGEVEQQLVEANFTKEYLSKLIINFLHK
ncbi:MAG: 1-deoxy-D-xylulose-5-phosphate synthase [Clostridia bacterium]